MRIKMKQETIEELFSQKIFLSKNCVHFFFWYTSINDIASAFNV